MFVLKMRLSQKPKHLKQINFVFAELAYQLNNLGNELGVGGGWVGGWRGVGWGEPWTVSTN